MRFMIFFKILLKAIILRKNVSNLERRVGLSWQLSFELNFPAKLKFDRNSYRYINRTQ